MKYNYKETILFYTIIFTLILLDSSLQQTAKTLDLNEGTVFFLYFLVRLKKTEFKTYYT